MKLLVPKDRESSFLIEFTSTGDRFKYIQLVDNEISVQLRKRDSLTCIIEGDFGVFKELLTYHR